MIIPNTRSAAWCIPGLSRISVKEDPIPTSSENIVYRVCKYFEVEPDELFSKSHKAEIVYRKHIAIYLLGTMTQLSLRQLAAITRVDYTGVRYARRIIANRITHDHETQLKADIQGILAIKDIVFRSDI